MYITVMDYSTSSINKLLWDVDDAETEEIEGMLENIGYCLSQISYMATDIEPDYGETINVSELL